MGETGGERCLKDVGFCQVQAGRANQMVKKAHESGDAHVLLDLGTLYSFEAAVPTWVVADERNLGKVESGLTAFHCQIELKCGVPSGVFRMMRPCSEAIVDTTCIPSDESEHETKPSVHTYSAIETHDPQKHIQERSSVN